ASTTQNGNAVLLKSPSGVFWRLKAAGAVMNLAESVYLGDGAARKTQQVVLDGHAGSTGVAVKWALKREAKKDEKPSEE
ncbi:MAG: heparinase II/III family protein, partial [Stellaceae bacterium]